MSIGPPIPEKRLFQILTLIIQCQGHRYGQRGGHIVGPASNWFTAFLFHINRTNSSCDATVCKFHHEKSKVNVMCEVKVS